MEVIYEDDQSSPARTVAAFNKLVEIARVGVVVTLGSTPSNAGAPAGTGAGRPSDRLGQQPPLWRETGPW